MQMQDFPGRYLAELYAAMLAAIIAIVARVSFASSYLTPACSFHRPAIRPPLNPLEKPCRVSKLTHGRVVRKAMLNEKTRILPYFEQTTMEAIGGTSGSPLNVNTGDVSDIHGRLASINRESGLYVRPSGSTSR